MASRAPGSGAELDYFPTPPWAARAGSEIIARLDPSAGAATCWEPAAGGGHMAHGLAEYFGRVIETDIVDHERRGVTALNFLDEAAADAVGPVDWIVTNPPFNLGEAFIRLAWARARVGVAMLLRLAFIETSGRYRLHYEDCPLTVLAPFSERVPMVKGRWDPEASSATAYAWFFYVKGRSAAPEIWPIGPGARARLSMPSDLVRFCGAADQAELFGVRG